MQNLVLYNRPPGVRPNAPSPIQKKTLPKIQTPSSPSSSGGEGVLKKHWSSCLPARREKEEEFAVKREKVDISTMKPRLLVASVPEELAPCSHSCFCVCSSVLCKCVCSSYVAPHVDKTKERKKGSPRIPPASLPRAPPAPPPRMMEAEGIARLAARDILLKFLYIDL